MQSAGAILVEEQTALMLLVYIWEPDKYTETGVEPGAHTISMKSSVLINAGYGVTYANWGIR